MAQAAPTLKLTQVGRVCIPTADVDRALDFYVGTLGFEKTVDVPMGDAGRWVEISLAGTPTTIALPPPPPGREVGGADTGIILDTTDVDADHAALKAAGADVDAEVTRPGSRPDVGGSAADASSPEGGEVPPMFWIRDPEGNSLIVVQPNR